MDLTILLNVFWQVDSYFSYWIERNLSYFCNYLATEYKESDEHPPAEEYTLEYAFLGVYFCFIFLGLTFSLTFYDASIDLIDWTL